MIETHLVLLHLLGKCLWSGKPGGMKGKHVFLVEI